MNISDIRYSFNSIRWGLFALFVPMLFGCVSPPEVRFPKGQAIASVKEIYLQAPNDADGFQLALINELAIHNITVIDNSYGGEKRIVSLSDKEMASYDKSPTRLSVSYAYEALYGWGAPITMSFQGKVVDLQDGNIVMTYSIERGKRGQRIKATAFEFATEISRLFSPRRVQ